MYNLWEKNSSYKFFFPTNFQSMQQFQNAPFLFSCTFKPSSSKTIYIHIKKNKNKKNKKGKKKRKKGKCAWHSLVFQCGKVASDNLNNFVQKLIAMFVLTC